MRAGRKTSSAWKPAATLIVAFAGQPTASLAQQVPQDGDRRDIRTWAEPGMVRNPVAFTMDPWGNVYIAESDRAGQAVTDTRQLEHLDGVEEDLLLRTVEDRRALIQKWIDQGAFAPDHFTSTEDRVRLVRDTDDDGVADTATVFAGAFNDAVDGIGAGVLWRDGDVYFTCIPHLWRLRDDDNDGVAEHRESVSYGYGVRWCFYGHDLHGLVNGPDGRVYFSMGDRGFNVEGMEGQTFFGPDRGGVFRCWPDGSGLELFCVGLRNPQELAFDEFGNLFTGDNNCDSGDRARVVYCMEGSDSGWRQNVQSLPSRGPWNREHMWELLTDPHDASRPAWCLPPIDHVGAGPSGLAYYPGTGENHAYDDTFLMVDFYGSGSTVHSFRARAEGAGFRLTEKGEYYRGTTVTDIMWGPDSRLYLSDWGEGWGPNDKGNMFTVTNSTVHNDARGAAEITEVQAILVADLADRATPELIGLMGHRDQRVRQASQYALAARGTGVTTEVAAVATDTGADLLQRVHAIWCLGQLARSTPGSADAIGSLLNDPQEQIRLASCRTLGDLRLGAVSGFRNSLADPSPAVRAAAAIALGKAGDDDAIPDILDALDANNDQDVYLRHGLAHGLALMTAPDALIDAVQGRGRAARLGAVLALRSMGDPGVVPFMSDPDPGVATEAVRAVYDQYIPVGMPALAEKIGTGLTAPLMAEPYLRRAVEANVYLGRFEDANRLAHFAANPDVPVNWRRLALERLRDWDQPRKREGVWGDWVDLPERPTDDARRAVLGSLEAIISGASGDSTLAELAEAVGTKYRLDIDVPSALATLTDSTRGESLRIVTLEQLASREPGALAGACQAVLAPDTGSTPSLRMRARELLASADTAASVASYGAALASGELRERQHAVRQLAASADADAAAHLDALTEQLREGTLDATIGLEVFETTLAEGTTGEPTVWEPDRPAAFQTPLLAVGGDPARGREVFLHHEAAQCARCHTVRGEEAVGIAGPELTAVGSRAGRAQLVRSLVDPNAEVAAGYGSMSAMPPMSVILTPSETRDVVAYLATLTGGEDMPEPAHVLTVADFADDRAQADTHAGDTDQARGIRSGHVVMLLSATAYLVALAPIGVVIALKLRRGGGG